MKILNSLPGFSHKFTKIKWYHWTSGLILTIITLLWGCGPHLYHIVEPGETLYSISWMYGHDYRTVAKWNRIQSPYVLHKGQRLRVSPYGAESTSSNNERETRAKSIRKSVTGPAGRSKDAYARADKPNEINTQTYQTPSRYRIGADYKTVWNWPVKEGVITQTFVANHPGKLGIDIAGKEGQMIYSASTGTVVYSGTGLPMYGKLIIIKHNDTYLSAYAHNKKLLVKEGEEIKAGQPIALMGKTGSNNTKLHFEIRRNGKPVDPISFLPGQTPN